MLRFDTRHLRHRLRSGHNDHQPAVRGSGGEQMTHIEVTGFQISTSQVTWSISIPLHARKEGHTSSSVYGPCYEPVLVDVAIGQGPCHTSASRSPRPLRRWPVWSFLSHLQVTVFHPTQISTSSFRFHHGCLVIVLTGHSAIVSNACVVSVRS